MVTGIVPIERLSETLDMRKIMLTLLSAVLLAAGGLWLNWQIRTPTHDRAWQALHANLPTVTKIEDQYQVTNIRNWDYGVDQSTTSEWLDATLDPEQLVDVYFVVKPFGGLDAVAHTMLAFVFADGSGYVASVEARRTEGQTYGGLLAGLVPMHEYMVVWATERDMYKNSTFLTGNALYMYRLTPGSDGKKAILTGLLEETARIAAQPRFYNTFFSNCAIVLARAVNDVSSGAVPWHYSWHLPGHAAAFLHGRGLIPAQNGFDALQKSAYITPLVADLEAVADPMKFSLELRERLIVD